MRKKHRVAAIETRYAGHLFRSRIEARWAAFFDACGLEWVYEPFDLAGYIPDFLVRVDGTPMVVEVKGLTRDDPALMDVATRTLARLRSASLDMWAVAVGCDPDFRSVVREFVGGVEQRWAIGLIGAAADPVEPDPSPCPACVLVPHLPPEALRSAWGAAHEISRWMPAVGAAQ